MMGKIVLGLIGLSLVAGVARAEPVLTGGLTGTEFSTQVVYQGSEGEPREDLSFVDTAIVGEGIEFESLAALEQDNDSGLFVVDVGINVGDQVIQILFDNAGGGTFASGFFNGYRFIFDSEVPVDILSASINTEITRNISVADSDLMVSGNELFLNVASRSFSSLSFIQIDLTAVGGPTAEDPAVAVSEPGGLMLPGLLILAVGLWRTSRRPL